MPRRPISHKKKKEQLQKRRQRKREDTEHSADTDENFTSEADTESGVDSASRQFMPNRERYRLLFANETKADIDRRKRQSREPLRVLPATCLELSVADFYPPTLNMPKRPTWSHSMSKEELAQKEQQAFSEFIDQIVKDFPDRELSYFEHNLETWRQLWRVLERSDIITLVVDARFPALHFPPYLYDYVVSLDKPFILIINKCDLVGPIVAGEWKLYFEQHFPKVHVVLFSSFEVQAPRDKVGTKIRRRTTLASAEGLEQLAAVMESLNVPGVEGWLRRVKDELELVEVAEGPHHGHDDDDDDDQEEVSQVEADSEGEELIKDSAAVAGGGNALCSFLANAEKGEREGGDEEEGDQKGHQELQPQPRQQQPQQQLQQQPQSQLQDGHPHYPRAFGVHQGLERDGYRPKLRHLPRQQQKSYHRTRAPSAFSSADDEGDEGSYDFESASDLLSDDLSSEDACGAVGGVKRGSDDICTIGLIGQPNVGKSTILNSLVGRHVVSCSRTPGHTKHFQTYFLVPEIRLCDSPGIIFPCVAPKCLQVASGQYPIAQTREPYSAVQYVAERLPLVKLLRLKPPQDDDDEEYVWSAWRICEAWADQMSYRTAKASRPDVYRAATHVLRLTVEGHITLALRPPGFSERHKEEAFALKALDDGVVAQSSHPPPQKGRRRKRHDLVRLRAHQAGPDFEASAEYSSTVGGSDTDAGLGRDRAQFNAFNALTLSP